MRSFPKSAQWGTRLALLVAFLPTFTHALTLVQVAELFNIFVGLVLTVGLLIYFAGLGVYFSRLGTWPNHRDKAIRIMEWGVAVLFVLIVILTVVQHFQRYPKVASIVIATLLILVLVGAGIYVYVTTQGSSEKKDEH